MYYIIDAETQNETIKECKTLKEAKQSIKELEEFDKRHNNINKTNFEIIKV